MTSQQLGQPQIRAEAGDPGFKFVLQSGLLRGPNGHLGTIVGRGGSGKSILALQIVTQLLTTAHEEERKAGVTAGRHSAAFYFTLEASPRELANQVGQFTWGQTHYDEKWERTTKDVKSDHVSGNDEYNKGLYLVSVPSPVESLRALGVKIRQTIAAQLPRIGKLAAIIIDPMGAVNAAEDVETNLIQLKELAETHSTFVFLLTEKHAFETNKAIEHYSQSIIHLEHEPGQRQHRRLHVQKARGQSFRSGYHPFYLHQPAGDRSEGIRVLPTIEAQSADAHYQLKIWQRDRPKPAKQVPLPGVPRNSDSDGVWLLPSKSFPDDDVNQRIRPGSAVFLMGPPGTFKEKLADQFAAAAHLDEGGATLYLSFKTDRGDNDVPVDSRTRLDPLKVENGTYFFDARNPLLTPEEILFTVRNTINFEAPTTRFKRAIVWGLRRLYDFPNFKQDAVQFLEALVTMLKARNITTLLVDWPDKQTATTVPIVDLCQYILLTRVCYRIQEREEIKNVDVRDRLVHLWGAENAAQQIALLRVQRTPEGVHHDVGFVYKQGKRENNSWEKVAQKGHAAGQGPPLRFEDLWTYYGRKWEDDLSLQS